MAVPSGPPAIEPELYEPVPCSNCRVGRREGAHYTIFRIKGGIEALKTMFPKGKADDLNFVLFSTSGVHGSYTTIEEIEESIKKYGDTEPEGYPDDWCSTKLTVEIIQPRICCLRYGNIEVTLEDIPFLKKLRKSSWKAVQKIGAYK
jgi:hypothetical protein